MLPTLVPNVAIRRRIMFAATFLPKEYPSYLDTVMLFASANAEGVSTEPEFKRKVAVAIDNTRTIYPAAFTLDQDLVKELVHMKVPPHGGELGVILISFKSVCSQCGSNLSLRTDRPSQVTVYSETVGTTSGMHYHKICKNPNCNVVQHFGYTTNGLDSGVQYDRDWKDLPYFVSSQKMVFETALLRKMDSELLIDQLSYNQKADIYNYYHGCYNVKKRNTKLNSKKKETSTHLDEGTSQTATADIGGMPECGR